MLRVLSCNVSKKVRKHVSCSAVEYMALVGSGVIERIHASLVLLDNRI